jgi:hypothetical protein
MAVTTRPASGAVLNYDGDPIGGIIDATVTLSIETTDITEVGLSDRKYVSGIRAGSASGNVFFDAGDAGIANLRSLAATGAIASFQWISYTGVGYTVDAIVTSFSESIAVADVIKASFELQFTGPVTIA